MGAMAEVKRKRRFGSKLIGRIQYHGTDLVPMGLNPVHIIWWGGFPKLIAIPYGVFRIGSGLVIHIATGPISNVLHDGLRILFRGFAHPAGNTHSTYFLF